MGPPSISFSCFSHTSRDSGMGVVWEQYGWPGVPLLGGSSQLDPVDPVVSNPHL